MKQIHTFKNNLHTDKIVPVYVNQFLNVGLSIRPKMYIIRWQ